MSLMLPEATDAPVPVEERATTLARLYSELKMYEPDDALIAELLSRDPSLAAERDGSDSTVLHAACANIENLPTRVFKLLLSAHPEAVKHANRFGLLPIHRAATSYCTEAALPTIQLLLDLYPKSLACKTRDGALPLHMSLSYPKITSYKLVEMLVDARPASVGEADRYGRYPLHRAASKVHVDPGIVSLLLDRAPQIAFLKDNNGWLPLHWALSKDCPSLEVFYLLVGVYAEGLYDPDPEGRTPYDKVMARKQLQEEAKGEILAVMEMAREQILSKKPKPQRVPSPILR
jgi:ankyrin repeat protein